MKSSPIGAETEQHPKFLSIEKEPISVSGTLSSLYQSLDTAFQGTALLETCVQGGGSILVWDPAATISVHDGIVDTQCSKNTFLPPLPEKPSQVTKFIQETLMRNRVEEQIGFDLSPPFAGGFVGVVGYEWATQQQGPSNPTETGVPDMWFGLYDRAIIASSEGGMSLVVVPSIRGASIEETRKQLKTSAFLKHNTQPGKYGVSRSSFKYDFSREDFEKGVLRVKKAIRAGDVYQVDIAQRIRSKWVDPLDLYSNLKTINPSPYAGILSTGNFTVVSGSPERLLKVWNDSKSGRWASTRPIAGTRPRGSGEQDYRNEMALKTSTKELAEHTMLVDLSRNDLGRVAENGSVEVDEFLTVERYSHVMHLVSNVKGRLRSSVGVPELFHAMMPGGSVTGTPKIRATEFIEEIEPVPRGAYTGSMGYISLDGSMDFNILIRSAFFPQGGKEIHLYAGAGIVQDSNPFKEWKETGEKLAAQLEALQGSSTTGFPWLPPRTHSSWHFPKVAPSFHESSVIIIDNYDSFTYNLVQYFSALGAKTSVFRNDDATLNELKKLQPTHVVLSPGPGRPAESGITVPAVQEFSDVPILGVCLGHQAIVEAYGGTLVKARIAIHGKASIMTRVHKHGLTDIMDGLPNSFLVGRYHSLIADEVPPDLVITGRTQDGEVMAIRHRKLLTFGVQFHPESILTQNGMKILSNFLSIRGDERGRA